MMIDFSVRHRTVSSFSFRSSSPRWSTDECWTTLFRWSRKNGDELVRSFTEHESYTGKGEVLLIVVVLFTSIIDVEQARIHFEYRHINYASFIAMKTGERERRDESEDKREMLVFAQRERKKRKKRERKKNTEIFINSSSSSPVDLSRRALAR